MKKSFGEEIFNIFNIVFMVFMMIITFYPFLYVIFASFSSSNELMMHQGLLLCPKGFNLEAYKEVISYKAIWTGYRNIIFIIAVGLVLNIAMTSLCAYALSVRTFMFRKAVTLFIMFTMLFSGGLIPYYFTIKAFGLYNNIWVLIIPFMISTYNMIILRSAFENIPESLKEAAKIDGAGHFTILLKIVLPLSMATIAVIALYFGVAQWNSWFQAAIFITNRELYPLQLVLREILIGNDTSSLASSNDISEQQGISESIKYAVIIVSTVPILAMYPYLQKYFIKGTMVGAVKG